MAFPPTCNRERDSAASHTSTFEGVSTIVVAVASRTAVSVGDGTIAGGTVVCVVVGEGIKVGVAVRSMAVVVPVGGGIEDEDSVRAVEVDESFVDVKLGDGKGNDVEVDESDGDVAVEGDIRGEIVSVTG